MPVDPAIDGFFVAVALWWMRWGPRAGGIGASGRRPGTDCAWWRAVLPGASGINASRRRFGNASRTFTCPCRTKVLLPASSNRHRNQSTTRPLRVRQGRGRCRDGTGKKLALAGWAAEAALQAVRTTEPASGHFVRLYRASTLTMVATIARYAKGLPISRKAFKNSNGGRDKDRTCDPYDVNVVLSR